MPHASDETKNKNQDAVKGPLARRVYLALGDAAQFVSYRLADYLVGPTLAPCGRVAGAGVI